MYEIEHQSIRFTNGKKHSFPVEVAEVLDFEDVIVIRLAASHLTAIQNIFGLDYQGNLLWKIPLPLSFSPQTPYVSLSRRGSYVDALNWDGHIVTLHPKKGHILGEDLYSGGAGSSRRTPSIRRWI